MSEQVKPKEPAIGVCDISQRTKAEALGALAHKLDEGKLSKREALAIKLVDRMVEDPHTVTDQFFNITIRVDTDPESAYPHNLRYASATSR